MAPLSDGDVGAVLPVSTLSLDDSPGASVKVGAGLLYGWHIQNAAGAITYVQLFDALIANVTLGSTTPTFVIGVQASGATSLALHKPLKFATGLVAFATTTPTGSTAATVHAVWAVA